MVHHLCDAELMLEYLLFKKQNCTSQMINRFSNQILAETNAFIELFVYFVLITGDCNTLMKIEIYSDSV